MHFDFPDGFENLPPDIQETIQKEMIQELILNIDLGQKFLDTINLMVNSINKVTNNPKYKDDKDISSLDQEVKEIIESVKREMKMHYERHHDQEE